MVSILDAFIEANQTVIPNKVHQKSWKWTKVIFGSTCINASKKSLGSVNYFLIHNFLIHKGSMPSGMYLTDGGTYFFVFILGVKYLFYNFIFNACHYFYNSSEDLEWSPSNVITCSTLKVAMKT